MNAIEIRHLLHDHPQLSGSEEYAHNLIVQQLQQLHPTKVYTYVGGYGVIAVWGTNASAPTLAFRADIDALPIGHRCGHDGHTAILLRFAERVDAEWQHNDSGNVLLIFQPAEETGLGAQQVIESGILQQYNIKAIYGMHNLPGYPLGQVVLNRHTFAAASTGIVFHLQGRPTHASTPEKGLNPGMAVAEAVQRMAQLNNAKGGVDDFRQSTLICARVGEPAFGTSAGEAELMFTLRAYSNNSMEHLLADVKELVGSIASRHHLQCDSWLQEPFRATENNSLLVEQMEEIVDDCTYELLPFRWSEDFANYLTLFKGCFFGIGAGCQQPELHHPDYDFPDALIEPAVEVFCAIWQHHNQNR